MDIRRTRHGGVSVLRCSGRLTRGGPDERFVAEVDADLHPGAFVVLDLGGLEWLDSSGLGALVACAKHAAERSAVVKAAVPPEGPVRRVFSVCHLDRVFETYDAPSKAVASFPAGG